MASSVDFSKSRAFTIALLQAMDDGLIDSAELVETLLGWMSEQQVKEFCNHYQFFEYDEQDS